MVTLKRLKIRKYRNVKPGTELHFRDSLNVMLGRNGTGKTTLLNLIVQLLSWDFSTLREEEVDLEYELHSSKDQLKLTVCFRTAAKLMPPGETDVWRSPEKLWDLRLARRDARYSAKLELKISRQGASNPEVLRVEDARIIWTSAQGTTLYDEVSQQPILGSWTLIHLYEAIKLDPPEGEKTLTRELLRFSKGRLMLLQRFDESLLYLEKITKSTTIKAFRQSLPSAYRAMSDGPYLFSSRTEEALAQNPEIDELTFESQDDGQDFLSKIAALLDFKSAKIHFQRTGKSAGPYPSFEFGEIRFSFTRRDGSVLDHSLLSYGQKRLLAFFYYLAVYTTSVVADELVNGMHHEWIEACFEGLGERQSFLTSQNPLLMDYLFFKSVEEVRSSFVLCRTEFHGDREQFRWENMTEEDAEGFFKAYEVKIQHVSELLRTRGLW